MLAQLKKGEEMPAAPLMEQRDAGRTAEHAAKLVGIGKSYVCYAAIRRDSRRSASNVEGTFERIARNHGSNAGRRATSAHNDAKARR
jgi:hypothetical protein